MITHCKVCEKEIKAVQFSTSYGRRSADGYGCECLQYSFRMTNSSLIKENDDKLLIVESETIMSKNYFLVFFPVYQEANVVEKNERNRIVKTFPLTELTHELAVQWVNKLKTYVLFQ